MTIGTLFTLFVVPSVYVLIAKDHRKSKQATEPPALGPTLDPEPIGEVA
jgi:multidrug efflux pump